MTPVQFKTAMEKIVKDTDGDETGAHLRMDALMVKLLRILGYSDGIRVFEAQNKWYE